jgi:hypothetical protein
MLSPDLIWAGENSATMATSWRLISRRARVYHGLPLLHIHGAEALISYCATKTA